MLEPFVNETVVNGPPPEGTFTIPAITGLSAMTLLG